MGLEVTRNEIDILISLIRETREDVKIFRKEWKSDLAERDEKRQGEIRNLASSLHTCRSHCEETRAACAQMVQNRLQTLEQAEFKSEGARQQQKVDMAHQQIDIQHKNRHSNVINGIITAVATIIAAVIVTLLTLWASGVKP